MIPFTYFIGWPHLNTFYYGVRYGKDSHPDSLWTTYFTSSKEVLAFRAEHGEPPLVEVRKVFPSKEKAREWEHKVLRRMKVRHHQNFLNITTSRAPSMQGKSHGEETRRKQSLTQKGKPKNPESILKMRATLTGRKMSDEARAAQSRGHTGLKFSDEHKANIAATKSGKWWWTNGQLERFSSLPPDENWKRGRLKRA